MALDVIVARAIKSKEIQTMTNEFKNDLVAVFTILQEEILEELAESEDSNPEQIIEKVEKILG